MYQDIFERLNDLIFLIDSFGRVYDSNQRQVYPKNIQELMPIKDWEFIQSKIQKGMSLSDPILELEVELTFTGDRQWYLCRLSCVETDEELANIILAFQNIQAQKEREEALIEAKDIAESQESIKGRFLANMSHEIRTPMNSIIGFSELMYRSNDKEEQSMYLDIIKSSGQFLLNIINDVIDISKIESGLLDIKVQRVDINELLNELSEIYSTDSRFHSDKVKIITHQPLKIGSDLILTDKTRLRQVLSNLMDNAVKFTHSGQIELGYDLVNSNASKPSQIQFYVKDSGIGIPQNQQQLIFDRFHQIREGDVATGSGLGLSIVQALVNKLGGEIKLESEDGKGSKFSFKIPYIQRVANPLINAQQVEDVAVPELKGHHILVAEDVDANFKFVSASLRSSHVKLTWVKNGKEAVEAVIKNNNFDLILMDLRMPVMDGYKASEQIKIIQPKIPIIGLSDGSNAGEMEKALEAGCDDYLSKPITIHKFYKKLNFYLNM